jgi:hypothetical protein
MEICKKGKVKTKAVPVLNELSNIPLRHMREWTFS